MDLAEDSDGIFADPDVQSLMGIWREGLLGNDLVSALACAWNVLHRSYCIIGVHSLLGLRKEGLLGNE